MSLNRGITIGAIGLRRETPNKRSSVLLLTMWTRPVMGGILAFSILFLTAALILPRVVCPPDGCSTKAEKTASDLSCYQSLLDVFHLECGRYPTTEEGLNALHTAPVGLKDKWGPHPYTDQTSFNDSWGNPYHYTSNDPNRYTLKSYGKDGQPGGEGEDIEALRE